MRADVPAIAELADNEKIFSVLARLPRPYTRADATAFVEIFSQRQSERVYAIIPHGGSFIGVVSFHFEEGEAPELGYWLGEPYWGQGYISEAAGALVRAAQATGQFPRIRAHTLATNSASCRILEKIGFACLTERLETQGGHAGEMVADFLLEARP